MRRIGEYVGMPGRVWVEPFYWGVREMLLRMSRHTVLMDEVDAALKAHLAKSGVTPE